VSSCSAFAVYLLLVLQTPQSGRGRGRGRGKKQVEEDDDVDEEDEEEMMMMEKSKPGNRKAPQKVRTLSIKAHFAVSVENVYSCVHCYIHTKYK